jgi:hypothetical protein
MAPPPSPSEIFFQQLNRQDADPRPHEQAMDGFQGGIRAQAVILKSETYHFHRLDLTRQTGFIVTVYDEDGLRLAATMPASTPAEAFREARKIVDNKVGGPPR